jgi:hypothetical protein
LRPSAAEILYRDFLLCSTALNRYYLLSFDLLAAARAVLFVFAVSMSVGVVRNLCLECEICIFIVPEDFVVSPSLVLGRMKEFFFSNMVNFYCGLSLVNCVRLESIWDCGANLWKTCERLMCIAIDYYGTVIHC